MFSLTPHKPILLGEEPVMPPSTPRWHLCATNRRRKFRVNGRLGFAFVLRTLKQFVSMSSEVLLEIFVAILRFKAKSHNQGKGPGKDPKSWQKLLKPPFPEVPYRLQMSRDFAVRCSDSKCTRQGFSARMSIAL